MTKKLIKHLSVVAIVCALFSSCKKDLNNPENISNSNESAFNPSTLRVNLKGNYSRIVYDANNGYLVFPDKETFQGAMNSLADEMKEFKYDKGQTIELIRLIESDEAPGLVKNELLDKSPLSSEVLIAFLNKNYPEGIVKNVLEENILFSEEVENVYDRINLSIGVRAQIDELRNQNLSFNHPILAEFESRFVGYTSKRKKNSDAEALFLSTGGDPESKINNLNRLTGVDDIGATLLNQYGEVKIGDEVLVVLADKDVKVANGKASVLNYIRANGDIPRIQSPASEPANGLPKEFNPAPIDPSISVEPNAFYNLNCGGVEVVTDGANSNRIFVSPKGKNDGNIQYYWDFGDGFVSYKEKTEHIYTDGLANHTVTVTVYNSYGVGCGSGASVHGTNQTQSSVLNVTFNSGMTAGFAVTTTIQNATFEWTFGDGSTQNTGTTNTVTHVYSTSGTKTVTVNIYNPNGTVEVLSVPVVISGTNNGGGSGSSSDVCDKRDREKEKWKSTDGSHKFVHKLRLKNYYLLACKLNSSVNTYRKTSFGKWVAAIVSTSWVRIDGEVFKPNAAGDEPCYTAHAVSASSSNTIELDNTAYRDVNVPFATLFVSVKEESILSQGSAFGSSDYTPLQIAKED